MHVLSSMENRSFAALLREQRLAAGLTQAALGERAGVAERTIQQLERGTARPQSDTVRRLVDALEPSPEDRAGLEAVTPSPRRRNLQRLLDLDGDRVPRAETIPNNLPIDRTRL